jgi:hypothetical protein
LKDNIYNESELTDSITVFFQHIEDTKIEEILNLMTNNYDIKTFKEFLRWFFEQKNDKDSYNFIQYYNKFAYIIDEDNKKDDENVEEDNDEEDDEEEENFNEKIRKQNCNKYKKILEKNNIVDESSMDTWKQINKPTNNKEEYRYDSYDYEMVLQAYKNVYEKNLCENTDDDETNLDESEIVAVYNKKMKIAKKLNIKFNPQLGAMSKDKYLYLIEILNTLINNNKNKDKNENYKAFNDNLWIRNFWMEINLNDENEVLLKIKEVIRTNILTSFYKDEKIYNLHKYHNIFSQMLNN